MFAWESKHKFKLSVWTQWTGVQLRSVTYSLEKNQSHTTKAAHCLQQRSWNDFLAIGHHLALFKCEVSQYKKVLHRQEMQLI